jgi:hypothetical protein
MLFFKTDFKQPLVWLGKVYLGKFEFVKVNNTIQKLIHFPC